MKLEFEWTDGWILMAVYGAQKDGSACLADITSAADVLNHAIPNTEELNRSLTKFLQAGILSVDEDRFTLTADACAGLHTACTKRGGLFSIPDKGLKFLAKLGATRQNEQVVDLSEDQVLQAYRKYIESIRPSRKRTRENHPPT